MVDDNEGTVENGPSWGEIFGYTKVVHILTELNEVWT